MADGTLNLDLQKQQANNWEDIAVGDPAKCGKFGKGVVFEVGGDRSVHVVFKTPRGFMDLFFYTYCVQVPSTRTPYPISSDNEKFTLASKIFKQGKEPAHAV